MVVEENRSEALKAKKAINEAGHTAILAPNARVAYGRMPEVDGVITNFLMTQSEIPSRNMIQGDPYLPGGVLVVIAALQLGVQAILLSEGRLPSDELEWKYSLYHRWLHDFSNDYGFMNLIRARRKKLGLSQKGRSEKEIRMPRIGPDPIDDPLSPFGYYSVREWPKVVEHMVTRIERSEQLLGQNKRSVFRTGGGYFERGRRKGAQREVRCISG